MFAENFIYISSILCMFILGAYGINTTRFIPFKLKILSKAFFLLIYSKCIVLFILFLSSNIKNLYILKPIYYIDSISISLAAIVSFYIAIRYNNFNLKYLLGVITPSILFYVILIIKLKTKVEIYHNNFYTFEVLNNINPYIFIIIVNIIVFIMSLLNIKTKHINLNLLYLIVFVSLISLMEIIGKVLFDFSIIPIGILGSLVWTFTMCVSIDKVKKIRI